LDEPTLSLDLSHQVLLFEIIRKLHREEGLTVVVATHDLNMAGRFLDRLVLMKNGTVRREGSPRKVLTPKNIRSVFGVRIEALRGRSGIPYFVPSSIQKVALS
jgi:iron complex transport system ATP-binding protein